VRDGYAYLADPSLGLRTLRLDEFENEWQGVVFFVAAQRNSTDPSALALLGGTMGPTEQVRQLDSIGLRSVRVISSREFRF
jgi:predicted double-glycine peptidase